MPASRRRWSSIRAKATASRSRSTSWTGCAGSVTGSPATTSGDPDPDRRASSPRLSSTGYGGRRTLLTENLRVARFYFVLLALFTVGRWAQSLGQVEYAKGPHVFSIVPLRIFDLAQA